MRRAQSSTERLAAGPALRPQWDTGDLRALLYAPKLFAFDFEKAQVVRCVRFRRNPMRALDLRLYFLGIVRYRMPPHTLEMGVRSKRPFATYHARLVEQLYSVNEAVETKSPRVEVAAVSNARSQLGSSIGLFWMADLGTEKFSHTYRGSKLRNTYSASTQREGRPQ